MAAPPVEAEPLRRHLGFVQVYALAVGGVIGTGIFFLPGKAAQLMGPAAVVPFVIAAGLAGLLVLCFAEAGSRFRGTGGAMTYAQVAFGDVAGFLAGFAGWVSRVVSWAALGNAFVASLDTIWPGAEAQRPWLLLALFGSLALVNLRGVALGAGLNTVLTVARLLPLLLFVGAGAFAVSAANFVPFAPRGFAPLGETTILVLYAYVGFEGLVVPAAEMRDPQRSAPPALLAGMATVMAVYIGVWLVCAGTHPRLASAANPVAEAAATFLGPLGTAVVQLGVVASVTGINAFMALVTPRQLYGLGHAGLLPRWIAAVDRRGLPARAILLSTGAALGLSLSGGFVVLAVVSVVARLAQYVPTALAVLRLRRLGGVPPATFTVPGGPWPPLAATAVCLWLLWAAPGAQLLWGGVAVGSGLLLHLPFRNRWQPRR